MRFCKMSNHIFELRLKSSEFVVLCALQSLKNKNHSVIIRKQKLADYCNISAVTCNTAINKLIKKGLIKKENRYFNYGYIANKYTVTRIIDSKINWFKIDYKMFNSSLSPTQFMVLCYFNRRKHNTNKEYNMSYSYIASEIGLSRQAVINTIKFLNEHSHLKKIHRTVGFEYLSNKYKEFKHTVQKTIFKVTNKSNFKNASPSISNFLKIVFNIICFKIMLQTRLFRCKIRC